MNKFDYSKSDILKALKEVGLSKGDNIFVHSNIGFFGRLEKAKDESTYYRIFKEAIFETIGEDGTLVVPVFTYSYCWNQLFDKENTKSVCGFFAENVRKDIQSIRSEDGNFSICAIGKNAQYFTFRAPRYSFGPGSFWDKFLEKNGKICNFNFDSGSTFIHYVERLLDVEYRYDKAFQGKSVIGGKEKEEVFYHFVYDLEKPNNGPCFSKFDNRAKERGLAKTSNLGRGQIVSISTRDVFELIKEEIKNNPAFLIKGTFIES